MASFLTATNNPTFTPYISTVNPELYGKLIIQKQQQYEQGIQKIQAYHDNITGLQVGRAEDAEYLQGISNKLHDGVSQLNNDFSDPDVIRKAEGLFHGAFNDRTLQTMVMSNKYGQDWQAQKQKAIESGTFAPQNADMGDEAYMAWQTGGKGAKLGKQSLTPWFDHSSEMLKHLRKQIPNVTFEQSSVMDADGVPIAYVVNDGKREYIPEHRVRSLIGLYYQNNAKAAGQLAMDSRYFTKGKTSEGVLQEATNYWERKMKLVDGQLLEYKAKLKAETNRPEAQKQYANIIGELTSTRDKMAGQQQKDYETAISDPQSLARRLYTEDLFSTYVTEMGYEKKSSKQSKNLMYEAVTKENKENRRIYEADRAYNYTAGQDLIKNDREERKLNAEIEKAQRDANGGLTDEEKALADRGISVRPNGSIDSEDLLQDQDPYGVLNKMEESLTQQTGAMLSALYGAEYTNQFMKVDDNGNIVVTDKYKFGLATANARKGYKDGAYVGKGEKVIGYFENDDANTGMNLVTQITNLQMEISKHERTGDLGLARNYYLKTYGIDRDLLTKKTYKGSQATVFEAIDYSHNPEKYANVSKEKLNDMRAFNTWDAREGAFISSREKDSKRKNDKIREGIAGNSRYDPGVFGYATGTRPSEDYKKNVLQKETGKKPKIAGIQSVSPIVDIGSDGKDKTAYRSAGRMMQEHWQKLYNTGEANNAKEQLGIISGALSNDDKGMSYTVTQNRNGEYELSVVGATNGSGEKKTSVTPAPIIINDAQAKNLVGEKLFGTFKDPNTEIDMQLRNPELNFSTTPKEVTNTKSNYMFRYHYSTDEVSSKLPKIIPEGQIYAKLSTSSDAPWVLILDVPAVQSFDNFKREVQKFAQMDTPIMEAIINAKTK